MDFYARVMGFRLVHVRRVPYEQDRWQPPYDNLRHYFFDMGNDSLFAVFEYPKGLPSQVRDHIGGMQHVAFHVPPEQFDATVAHVKSCGVHVIGPVPLGRAILVGLLSRSVRYAPRARHRPQLRSTGRGRVGAANRGARRARSSETLFSDPAEIDKWLSRMPLKQESWPDTRIEEEEAMKTAHSFRPSRSPSPPARRRRTSTSSRWRPSSARSTS